MIRGVVPTWRRASRGPSSRGLSTCSLARCFHDTLDHTPQADGCQSGLTHCVSRRLLGRRSPVVSQRFGPDQRTAREPEPNDRWQTPGSGDDSVTGDDTP